jgi:hypothetical protein
MAGFSASQAVGAGFTLIGRRPVSVFIWGLFAVILTWAPLTPMIGTIVPSYVEMLQMSGRQTGAPDVANLMALEGRLFGAMAWMWPLGLVAATINMAAVFRAVLEPGKRSFASLRLGMQEVWLFVLLVVEFLLVIVFVAAAALVVTLLSVAAARYSSHAMAVIVGLATGFASFVLLFWIWLRLSLAAPMTFADRGLRVFESWSLTRGHAVQLLLLALLQLAILGALGMMVQVVEGAPLALLHPFTANPDALRAWFAHPPAITVWAPWVILGAVVMAAYIGALRSILSAPWAAAYRELKGDA